MTSSLMLKSPAGAALGYLLAQKDEICVMVKGNGEQGILTVLSKGENGELVLECDSREHIKAYPVKGITGAYVTVNGALYALAGKAARESYEAAEQTKEKKAAVSEEIGKKECEICKKDETSCVIDKRELQNEALFSARPERRWPPPPCMPGARYVQGVWLEGGAQEKEGGDI